MWFDVDCVNEDIDHDSEQNHDFDGISVKIVMEKLTLQSSVLPLLSVALNALQAMQANARRRNANTVESTTNTFILKTYGARRRNANTVESTIFILKTNALVLTKFQFNRHEPFP